jgi:hypothetical protein
VTNVQIAVRGLRRRIHVLESHDQHFERCESKWCNPPLPHERDQFDPAMELGKPDKFYFVALEKAKEAL